jgi:hypothetical protein
MQTPCQGRHTNQDGRPRAMEYPKGRLVLGLGRSPQLAGYFLSSSTASLKAGTTWKRSPTMP